MKSLLLIGESPDSQTHLKFYETPKELGQCKVYSALSQTTDQDLFLDALEDSVDDQLKQVFVLYTSRDQQGRLLAPRQLFESFVALARIDPPAVYAPCLDYEYVVAFNTAYLQHSIRADKHRIVALHTL